MIEQTSSSAGASPMVPGRLRNFVEITIQTRQAQRLLRGRRGEGDKQPIIGLYRYGAMTRTLWTASERNDPYADWYLLKVEQALTESRDEIDAMKKTLDEDMTRVSAMRIDLAHSVEPTTAELSFSNPYGYMGAWLLIDLDQLVLAILTARHVGLMTRDTAERKLAESGRAVRRALASPQGYKVTAVKREDLSGGTKRAERAKQAMGELPQAVIDGKLRPENAPNVAELRQPDGSDSGDGHTVINSNDAVNGSTAAGHDDATDSDKDDA